MRRILRPVFIAAMAIIPAYHFLIANASAQSVKGFNDARPKKVIEWGGDEPTTAFLRENIEKVESLPFDGLVLPLKLRDGTDVSGKMWSAGKIDYAGIAYMADDLANTPFKRLTGLFIRVNVTPGDVRWTDEEAWSAVLHNFAAAAKVAKAGGCKGFMFDTEQYRTAPLSTAFANANDAATQAAYRQLIRQRGRELISAIAREFPDIAIIFTHAYYSAHSDPKTYAYLPDFLDGMFEAAPLTVRLVDGWEHAYGAKTRKDYLWAYGKLKDVSPTFSAIPATVKKRIEAGFGIWIDCTYNNKTWQTGNPASNYFTPAEFETSVREALSITEEYVWIYSETLNWWERKNIPPEYIEALRKAKNPG